MKGRLAELSNDKLFNMIAIGRKHGMITDLKHLT